MFLKKRDFLCLYLNGVLHGAFKNQRKDFEIEFNIFDQTVAISCFELAVKLTVLQIICVEINAF